MNALTAPSRVCQIGLVVAFMSLMPGCSDPLTEYVSEEGRFRIRLPGSPVEAKPGELPKGKHKVSLEQRSGTYTVSWEDLPGKEGLSAEDRLEAACEGAIASLKAKALTRKKVTLAGDIPGREMIAEWAGGVVHLRLYLLGQRLYTVMAVGEKWWVEQRTSRQVLASFEPLSE